MLSGFAELMTNRYHASHIFIYIFQPEKIQRQLEDYIERLV